jgi:two-component system NarL family response regulator
VTIRVAIVEDQRLLRDLVGMLLANQSDMEVVGEASSGREALRMTAQARPDVVLLDIGLPDLDGIEVARRLRRDREDLKIIALSVHADPHLVHQMLQAGANGYVVKSAAASQLERAIRVVLRKRVYLSPEIERSALEGITYDSASGSPELGPRERQVLTLLAEGKRSNEIASKLGISGATVEVHRRNIMRKLDAHSVAQLTKYAIRHGFTSL